jgi:hypothetical protein
VFPGRFAHRPPIRTMNILYYDCFAGISGDMHLAALLDLGLDYDELVLELAKLGLDGYGVQASRATRRGIAGYSGAGGGRSQATRSP